MPKKPFEKRIFNFDVRAMEPEDKEGIRTIAGRPVVYDSTTDMGWFFEVIDSGALDGTDLTDVRFLVNHDLSKIPLARSRRNNMNSTMRLMPVPEGLDMESDIDVENNNDARALASAVERGDISGMSFMFSVDEERWEDLDSEKPVRHITKIASIIEVSAVTFPAYQDTDITARAKEGLESAKRELENARARAQALENAKKELELAKTKALLEMR